MMESIYPPQPVTAAPLPAAVRAEVRDLVREGHEIVRVVRDDLDGTWHVEYHPNSLYTIRRAVYA
jgi:hypothetical protein